jgi:hypothetical protein
VGSPGQNVLASSIFIFFVLFCFHFFFFHFFFCPMLSYRFSSASYDFVASVSLGFQYRNQSKKVLSKQ